MRNTTAPSPQPLRKSLRTLQLLLTLLATLAAVPAQAQRMPQDSWYYEYEPKNVPPLAKIDSLPEGSTNIEIKDFEINILSKSGDLLNKLSFGDGYYVWSGGLLANFHEGQILNLIRLKDSTYILRYIKDASAKIQHINEYGESLYSFEISFLGTLYTGPFSEEKLRTNLNYLNQYNYDSWTNPIVAPAYCQIQEVEGGDILFTYDTAKLLCRRSYRLAPTQTRNFVPLPKILSQSRRNGTTLVDIDYVITDPDSVSVQTAILAFKDGGSSLKDIIPVHSFAEDTNLNLGMNITTGEKHRLTWDVSKDWNTDFGTIQFEILAKDNRNLVDLDFITTPSSNTDAAIKFVKTPVQNSELLSAFLWLFAARDPEIKLQDAQILSINSNKVLVNDQDAVTDDGVAFIMSRMGLRKASDAELARAKTFGTFWTWVMPTGNN